MKKALVILSLLAATNAHAIGITQTIAAVALLPSATLTLSISGVNKEILYKDGVAYVVQSEVNPAAQPSMALKEQIDIYAEKQGLENVDYLALTEELLKLEVAQDLEAMK